MKTFLSAMTACVLLQATALLAVEAPALDAKAYPQDTPQAALGSIVKAMDAKDFAYWVTWLIIPVEKDRILQKYKNLDGLIAVNAEPKRAEAIKAQSEILKKLLASNTVTDGETNGVKWARFSMVDAEHKIDVVLQLEKQADGRWAMNTKIRNTEQAKAWPRSETPEPVKETK